MGVRLFLLLNPDVSACLSCDPCWGLVPRGIERVSDFEAMCGSLLVQLLARQNPLKARLTESPIPDRKSGVGRQQTRPSTLEDPGKDQHTRCVAPQLAAFGPMSSHNIRTRR